LVFIFIFNKKGQLKPIFLSKEKKSKTARIPLIKNVNWFLVEKDKISL
jgi:hypothetical protein